MNKRLKDVDLYKNYCNWIAKTGNFRCFFRSTNFVSLQHYPDFELSDFPTGNNKFLDRAFEQVEGFIQEGVFVIFDLPGKLSMDLAYVLCTKKTLNPILVFNGILHPFGLIGDQEYISRLLGYGEVMKDISTGGFALVLDSERYGNYSDAQLKEFFNNQYELGEEDLPSAEMLKEQGYESVLYIFQNAAMEDVAEYLDYLSEEGISVLKQGIQGELS
jgi:hypothetical protein